LKDLNKVVCERGIWDLASHHWFTWWWLQYRGRRQFNQESSSSKQNTKRMVEVLYIGD